MPEGESEDEGVLLKRAGWRGGGMPWRGRR